MTGYFFLCIYGAPEAGHISCWHYLYILQVFSRINNTHAAETGHLELISEDRYDDVLDIIANHFMKNEPLCNAFGVQMSPFFERRILARLKNFLSVAAISDKTNDIMGVSLCQVAKTSDKLDLNDIDDESTRALLTFLTHRDSDNPYNYGVAEVFCVMNLAVHEKYRRRGLGYSLLGTSVTLAKELGFKAIKGEATSNFSQRLFEKHGFECILELPYNQYKYRDVYLSERTGEHTRTKRYMLYFSSQLK